MADMINFTLPKIDEGSDKQTLKQIKNYLFQLTEQMRYYLNNIDSDNFTEEYYEKMSHMVDTGTSNSKQMDKIQQREHRIVNEINLAKDQIARTIANNKGGYIIFNDTDGDELPDELIICDRPRLEDADKMWRWNLGGLMYNDGGYIPADDMENIDGEWYEVDPDSPEGETNYVQSSRKIVMGIDMNGNINASAITTGTLTAIEIKGLHGEIGGWDILSTRLEADNTTSGGYRSGMQSLLNGQGAAFYAGCNTVAGGVIEGNSNFYVTQGGYLFSKSGTIGGWNVTEDLIYNETTISGTKYRAYLRAYKGNINLDPAFAIFAQTSSSTTYPILLRYNGELIASKATITGTINATDGNFSGNITLGGSLSSTRGDYTVTVRGVQSSPTYGVIYITDNSGSSPTYPFVLKGNGELVATKATITGTINATGGDIGGWTINSDSLSSDYGNYRVYIQTPTASKNWAFSCQVKENGKYYGKFVAYRNGDVMCQELTAKKITCDNIHPGLVAGEGVVAIGVNTNGRIVFLTSSARYKENITETITDEFNPQRLYSLPVKLYNYKAEHKDKELVNGTQIGIIAEDVEKYYPNALIRNEDGLAESWQDRIMIPAMLKLIQEQHMEIENLKRSLL